jgi:DNA-binding response OmpR family regulator
MKKNVLIVEDDNDSRQTITMMVEVLGYNPIPFPGGKEALEKLPELTIHLALLDIMMPGMDGYQLLEEMRKIPNCATTPVIMVTAKDRDSEVLEGYQSGADYYITKPFTAKQLEYGIKMFL